jgi:hypothetical protein
MKATSIQLETLADALGIPLDDLLDEGMNQGEVRRRLTDIFHSDVIPQEVLEARRAAKELAATAPTCRICSAFEWDCEGRITRHHFIPRWMMLTLENYQAYAARVKCTIPICVGRHRDLHLRGDTDTPKSIAQFLTEPERAFAQKMLDELRDQHPAVFDLIAAGDESTYEAVLIRDYMHGAFRKALGDAVPAHQIKQGESVLAS